MRGLREKFWHYLKKDSAIDVTLFKILGIAGVIVSIVAGIQSIFMGVSVAAGLTNFCAAFLSVLLLWYVDRTGKYVIGYIITTIVIFMGLFTLLFFEMGGLDGSTPYFFAFSLVFSFLMFRGKLLVLMETVETVYYVGLCYFSYLHPEYVTAYSTQEAMVLDRIAGFVLEGLGIGLIFLAYIAQYRKQKEIAEEASNAKSRFLANMSHEIRTPINMMMGMNEMIYRETDSETIREYSQNVESAGKQLLFEINQVLQFSRLNAVKEELISESYDLPEMLNNLSAYFGKEASNKGLEFLMLTEGELPKVLKGDMRKLLQIITNLLSNAIKYTKEGCVTFTVRNDGIKDNRVSLYLEVKDTGIGIEKGALKTIFSSFERADIKNNRNIEGTGLGLAIAEGLAELFGSRIEVESEYGKGSRFFLRVTQEIGDKAEAAGNEYGGGSFIAPDAKVLVVDDNRMNLSVVKSLLKKTLVHVITAENAEESYKRFEEEKPDLVLMDYMMPGTDGIAAMEHLREMDADKHTPILVLTADVTSDKRELFMKKGFDGCIYKPIDWKELEKDMAEYLPERLVTRMESGASLEYSKELIEHYSTQLKEYDISLDEGLKYVGGDLKQYARIAGFFLANADKGIENMGHLIEISSIQELVLLFHSLKGNARNVGAADLYHSARRLEMRARRGDMDYIVSAAAVARFEWTRVKEGLSLFMKEFKAGEDSDGSANETVAYVPVDIMKRLLEHIESNNKAESLTLLDELIASEGDEEVRARLNEAKKQVSEIEFEAAQKIIRGILE